MLIVVHDHNAIHGGRNGLVIIILVAHLDADVQLHPLGVQVRREFVQESYVSGLRFLRERFEIDHQTAIVIGGKKEPDLSSKPGTSFLIVQEITHARNKVGAVKVLHHRKHFHVGAFRLQKRHYFVVHRMHRLPMNHVEHRVRIRIHGLQMAVWTENLKPCREKQVDLARVLAQGRETGRVPGNVERGSYPLLGVQRELGGSLSGGAAVSGAGQSSQAAFLTCFRLFVFFKSVVRTLFCKPGKIGQRVAAQGAIDEKDHQQRKGQGGRVENAANPPPARLVGIVENLFRHLVVVSTS